MMEEKIVISTILRRFQLKSVVSNHEDLEKLGELILRPKNGLHIEFTRRN